MKSFSSYNSFLVFIVVLCLFLLVYQNSVITGHSTANATSNVTVSKFLSIDFSGNLSDGIQFGSVDVLPSTNINASANYIGASNGTEYFVNVSDDSNTNVDFCIKADGPMTSLAADEIGLGNESYNNASTTDLNTPSKTETSLTTSYVKSGVNISIGNPNYYRFWLDIPVAQPSGDYNNTISFKGVQSGLVC